MGSQFVDLDADGHLDYLTATFDGSPHVSFGSTGGFGTPEHIKDAQGRRILISSIWDYEAGEHRDVDPSLSERCISALAFDWDADGDYDLLLGSYENGHLYRQMNEGTNAEPKFSGTNLPVMAGGAPFALPAKMTAPRLVDWDGDGDLDLIAGSFGDAWGQEGTGGGVYLSRNRGTKGAPAFGALEALVEPGPNGGTEPTRPNAGLYADAADIDGDGDLDLVVGGYSLWTPPGRPLSDEEQATVARLRDEQDAVREKQAALMEKVRAEVDEAAKGLDPKGKEYRAKLAEVYQGHTAELDAIRGELQAVKAKIEELVPAAQRVAYVWFYERQ